MIDDVTTVLTALTQLLIAAGVLVNIFIALKQGRRIQQQGENIQKIETATNSMKDALVAASEDKGFLAGQTAERTRVEKM